MEFGPYIYREYDDYDNLTYTQLPDPQTGLMQDAVSLIYNQYTEFTFDSDGYIDTKMYQVNQAGLGVWWGQNFSPKWRVMITLMYSLVLDGLGIQVQETAVFAQMLGTEFKTESKINSEFVANNPISNPAVVTALYTDPFYGLDNDENYFQWNVLLANQDPLERAAFKAELRTYFGLTVAQVDEME